MDDIIAIGGYRQHPTALSELYISRLSLLANNTGITHDLEHSKLFINYKMVLKCSGSELGKPDRLMSGSSCPKVPRRKACQTTLKIQ